MNSREIFLKGELNNFYEVIKVCYDYAHYSQLEDNKRFIQITKLLFEINKKLDSLNGLIRGFFLYNY